ncbi:MAG: hypothetical protein GXY44_00785 [Phycisphaerales bacterium]|nr:hypothetical protein [Phycisphaerales bacterium]
MKTFFGAHCDDFFASCRLFLKLDLPLERETILHFFDRIRREIPTLRHFRRRDTNCLVLEEQDPDTRDNEPHRWLRLESQAMRFGYLAPPSPAAWQTYGNFVLEQAPFHLTINDLDLDHIDLVYGFDLEYNGNHDQLVAETFFADHPLTPLLLGDEAVHTIDCQPYFGIALSADCNTQAYVEIKGRTSSFEVRTGEYETQILSVYLTLRGYWTSTESASLSSTFTRLVNLANELAAQRVVPLVVNPLALAIASRS